MAARAASGARTIGARRSPDAVAARSSVTQNLIRAFCGDLVVDTPGCYCGHQVKNGGGQQVSRTRSLARLTPIHSLRRRLVRSRHSASCVALGFLRY
eukprot:scaffold82946_cov34-Phaeocystis_antarctica.AAC.1